MLVMLVLFGVAGTLEILVASIFMTRFPTGSTVFHAPNRVTFADGVKTAPGSPTFVAKVLLVNHPVNV